MQQQIVTGFTRGTGADVIVELGFVPDVVEVTNLTDGDKIHRNHLHDVAAFTSGSVEIARGALIKGVTSGAYGRVSQVILDSGAWADGDAAGWIVLAHEGQHGTFSGENVGVVGLTSDTPTNDATLAATFDQDGVDVDTEVAGTTTAATNIRPYLGTEAGLSKGFVIGATISENAKLLGYVAYTSAPGISPSDIAAP